MLSSQCNRKRGSYHHYDDELKASVAKYACTNGNKAAVTNHSETLGHPISESTVSNFKHTYLLKLKET